MDLRQLREQTRREHEATEAALPLTAPGLGVGTYKAALWAIFPIVEGWENWAADHAPEQVQPLLARRRRSYLLRQDLASFGMVVPAASVKDRPVAWDTVVRGPAADETALSGEEFNARFLGALYVMEGSTLGGRFIARHVEAALGLEPGRGNAYFRGHGEATGALWRETTALIAAVPEEYSDRVIAAAKRTFAAFGAALAECLAGAEG